MPLYGVELAYTERDPYSRGVMMKLKYKWGSKERKSMHMKSSFLLVEVPISQVLFLTLTMFKMGLMWSYI